MIFELLGHNVPGYFIDPNYENQQFLSFCLSQRNGELKIIKNLRKKFCMLLKVKNWK